MWLDAAQTLRLCTFQKKTIRECRRQHASSCIIGEAMRICCIAFIQLCAMSELFSTRQAIAMKSMQTGQSLRMHGTDLEG